MVRVFFSRCKTQKMVMNRLSSTHTEYKASCWTSEATTTTTTNASLGVTAAKTTATTTTMTRTTKATTTMTTKAIECF